MVNGKRITENLFDAVHILPHADLAADGYGSVFRLLQLQLLQLPADALISGEDQLHKGALRPLAQHLPLELPTETWRSWTPTAAGSLRRRRRRWLPPTGSAGSWSAPWRKRPWTRKPRPGTLAQHLPLELPTEGQVHAPDQQGFPRAGLSGEDVQALAELHLRLFHQCQVLHMQASQHLLSPFRLLARRTPRPFPSRGIQPQDQRGEECVPHQRRDRHREAGEGAGGAFDRHPRPA